jgi:thioredoxin-dependent peroxiredoxin
MLFFFGWGFSMFLTRRSAILGGLTVPLAAQTNAPPSTTLKVGDKAPDFTIPSTEGGTVHLADYIGKSTVVLAFFPAAFTGG